MAAGLAAVLAAGLAAGLADDFEEELFKFPSTFSTFCSCKRSSIESLEFVLFPIILLLTTLLPVSLLLFSSTSRLWSFTFILLLLLTFFLAGLALAGLALAGLALAGLALAGLALAGDALADDALAGDALAGDALAGLALVVVDEGETDLEDGGGEVGCGDD